MKRAPCCLALMPLVLALVLDAADAKGNFYGNPYRYNLFKAGAPPQHNPAKPMSRHKNHCAYIVQKNVTCTMQDGMATYVKADYTTKCIWGQKCPVLMYRTFYKPTYKVGYKMVTELEWRCCPGYSGENCFDGPTPGPDDVTPSFKGPRPGVKGFPWSHPNMPGTDLHPGKPFPFPGGQPDNIPTGQLPSGGPKVGVTGERLDRMEDDLRKLSRGLETLNGLMTGLEERLRVSLRENTKKMLNTMLSSTPHQPDTTVEIGVIPEGVPDAREGSDGFPVFGELIGRVTEVKDELRVKSEMLDELHGMVMGHDGQLKRLMETPGKGDQRLVEELLDTRLDDIRTQILDGFERRLSGLEDHCNEKIGQVQQQCHTEHLNGQEQLQQSLDGRETGLRKELGDLQAQIQGLTVAPGCCGQINDISQRTLLLEESVKGLTESQRQLQTALTEQTLHLETVLDARLLDVESRLNVTEQSETGLDFLGERMDGFNTLLEDKLKNLEERVFVAVEELSNATAPALLEGQVVPALGTEIENLRRHVKGGLDGIQNQLTDLELLCTSACSSAPAPDTGLIQTEVEDCKEKEKEISDRLDSHSDMLNHLNGTLQGLLMQLAQKDQEGSIQGEITLLKVNFNSVNRTIKGLRDSVHLFTNEMSHANSTWQERQHRLASQVQGIADIVGQQGVLLGSGERRLLQLKSELQGMKRRLSGELQSCRGTALDTHREVMGVESRVAQVEGQCSSLGELADQLERIRAELESHSDSYLAQVNGTLASHTQELAQLKDGLQECVNKADK
ncbi:EMILIN-3 [Trichomycterus rosablanca]|uniref:EMILIN-3 n=1 Tax=Trichomycterus rosablanca TaxID=2290929 RepID=UPI002F359834